jgi:hypothetical protein
MATTPKGQNDAAHCIMAHNQLKYLFLTIKLLEGQGSKRRDNLAYKSNVSRIRKALLMMAAKE